jgi:sulfur relay (sulfurtransferase) complex TusBCD TusD component (DsrE family)
MVNYLLIESRDPFESRGFAQRSELASLLVADGAGVTVFLVENGVLAARAAAKLRELDKLAKSGVEILADDFALKERGIAAGDIATAVKPAQLDALIARLGAGTKAIWN